MAPHDADVVGCSRRTVLRALGWTGAAASLSVLTACTAERLGVLPGSSTANPSVPSGVDIVDVTSFGAVGDGRTDDTAALQSAFAAVKSGQALRLPAGKTFVHNDVLRLATPTTWLIGPGSLLAGNESASSVQIQADNVTVDGVTLAIRSTTQRWSAPEQHKLFVAAFTGAIVRNVSITGSAAAGLFCLGPSNFLLDHVRVADTRADGIHMTGGSSGGRVVSPIIERSGDDGVAVVSYLDDSKACADIVITSPSVRVTTGGRGVSVVGGTNITYRDIAVSRSSAAAVYVACEGGDFITWPTSAAQILGGTIEGANTNSAIDHGAVLVYSGRSGGGVSSVMISQLQISNTRTSASRQIGVVRDGADPVNGIRFENIRLDSTPTPYQGNAPSGSFLLTDVTAAGKKVVAG